MSFLLTSSDVMMCPHGGTVSISSSNTKANAGATIVRPSDIFTVAGCTFTIPPSTPSPCVTVDWQIPANNVMADSAPALTSSSIGLCKAATQAVQGTVIIQSTQTKVSGK
jgi:hypothetical protein